MVFTNTIAMLTVDLQRTVHHVVLEKLKPISFFGFFRGCLLTSIFVLGGQLTSAPESEWWNRSDLIPYSKLLADKMIEYIPTEINFTIKENDLS